MSSSFSSTSFAVSALTSDTSESWPSDSVSDAICGSASSWAANLASSSLSRAAISASTSASDTTGARGDVDALDRGDEDRGRVLLALLRPVFPPLPAADDPSPSPSPSPSLSLPSPPLPSSPSSPSSPLPLLRRRSLIFTTPTFSSSPSTPLDSPAMGAALAASTAAIRACASLRRCSRAASCFAISSRRATPASARFVARAALRRRFWALSSASAAMRCARAARRLARCARRWTCMACARRASSRSWYSTAPPYSVHMWCSTCGSTCFKWPMNASAKRSVALRDVGSDCACRETVACVM